MKEEWKEIAGYKGKYLISNFGDVKSFKKYRYGVIRKLSESVYGYLVLILGKNDGGKQFRVHRLVAKAFIPKIKGKDQVNHIDGDKKNNRVDNLEWCNHSENQLHAYRCLGKKATCYWRGKFGKNHTRSKMVAQKTLEGDVVKVWDSMMDAERNGFSNSHIAQCCKGKRNNHGGFKWEYASNIKKT